MIHSSFLKSAAALIYSIGSLLNVSKSFSDVTNRGRLISFRISSTCGLMSSLDYLKIREVLRNFKQIERHLVPTNYSLEL